jgi:glycosyltransferase involved in cell wall biosynthesis
LTREAQVKDIRRCKISEILVFVPTYNSEKYLRQCLDSVLQQTFQDWQCVISDDASSDRSVEIAREYENIDSRFKVLTHTKNVGAASNWNRAKENNNSYATKILCADDYLFVDSLEKQINLLRKFNTSIVFSERHILLPSGRLLHPKLPKYSNSLSFNDAFTLYIKSGRNIFGEPVGSLFRTKSLIASKTFNPKFEFALDTSCYASIAHNQPVTFDSNVVGVFRVSKSQWSYQLRREQFFHIFEFIDHLILEEGIKISRFNVILGKIKVVIANMIRILVYKLMKENK